MLFLHPSNRRRRMQATALTQTKQVLKDVAVLELACLRPSLLIAPCICPSLHHQFVHA